MTGIGTFLRELRCKNSLTIGQLALYARIDVQHLKWIECGRALPSKYLLLRLAAGLGSNETDLLKILQLELIGMGSKEVKMPCTRMELLKKEYDSWSGQGGTIKLLPLNDELSVYIESVVFFEKQENGHHAEVIMPDGMPQLIISLQEPIPAAFLVGQRDIPIRVPLASRIRRLIIRFRPQALFLLTGIPQNELHNTVLDAAYIFGRDMDGLLDDLVRCRDTGEMERVLAIFLKGLLERAAHIPVEAAVVRYLLEHVGEPVHSLVKKAGYSQKHLIHLFRTHIGLPPKVFQQVRQFSGVLHDLSLLPTRHLNGVVWEHAYFDQAHLTRQFSRFSGFTPSGYLMTGNACHRMIFA